MSAEHRKIKASTATIVTLNEKPNRRMRRRAGKKPKPRHRWQNGYHVIDHEDDPRESGLIGKVVKRDDAK